MSNTFTGLLRTLKSTSPARESMLLSSCEMELTELMRQIDIMVESKRVEWEQQLKAIHGQCERKERDLHKLQETLEFRNKEVGQLQQTIESEGDKHKKMISRYEEQLGKLKLELDNVKRNYGKLQRNSTKQSADAEKIKDQLNSGHEKHQQEMQRKAAEIEDLETKVRDLETSNEIQEAKLKGMEETRRSFVEKSEIMQNQLLSYQGQLTRKKQLLDSMEQKHVIGIAELENEILRQRDELETQAETVRSLKISLQESKSNEESHWKEQSLLKDEVSNLQRSFQRKDQQISNLEKALTLGKSKKKQESRSVTFHENSLLEKSKQQEKILTGYKDECNRLKKELAEKVSKDEQSDASSSVSKDIAKLHALLDQRKGEHGAELEGMRIQVKSLIEELHRRDAALANMSERAARMEESTRDLSSKHDKKAAELQVANAQLEALRLENRHLRDSSIQDHLSITEDLRMFETHIVDTETSNARIIAQLEDENNLLKYEVDTMKNEKDHLASDALSAREAETQLSVRSGDDFGDRASERITSLQDRLNESVSYYQEKLNELRAQNQSLKTNDQEEIEVDLPVDKKKSSDNGEHVQRFISGVNDDFNEDGRDLSNFLEVLKDDSVTSSSPGSRRQSITKDFMNEEDRREKELQSLLKSRIVDLEQKTHAAIKKYNL